MANELNNQPAETGYMLNSNNERVNIVDLILNIQPGGSSDGSSNTYGLENYFGEVSDEGLLQLPTNEMRLIFKGVKKISKGIIPNSNFNYCANLVEVSFPDLEELVALNPSSDEKILYQCFNNLPNLTKVSFPKIKSIPANGSYGVSLFVNCFDYCPSLTGTIVFPELESINTGLSGFRSTSITTLDFPKLREIKGGYTDIRFSGISTLTNIIMDSLESISSSYWTSTYKLDFSSCSSLTSLNFPKLTSLMGPLNFQYCTSLKTINFPQVDFTENNNRGYKDILDKMLQGVTGCTVHFPSNMESVISSWNGVNSGFGGTNTTILFDL